MAARRHPMTYTLAGIEELNLFPDEASRQQAIHEHASSIKGWDLIIGVAIAAGVGLAGFVLAKLAVDGIAFLVLRFTGWSLPGGWYEVLIYAMIVPCMYFTIRGLHRWGARRELRQKLLNLGVPVCLRCGYLLRGLSEMAAKCPECGAELDSRARLALRGAGLTGKAARE